jgi:outer membrane protein assembly factor BamB
MKLSMQIADLNRFAVALIGLSLALGVPSSAAQENGSWPMPGENLAGFRYSELDQINADNVGQLAVAWTFSLGVLRGQEAAPIVAENTMFVVTAYPNILCALDLSKPGAPVKWKHEPKPVAAAQGVACCDTVNRGAVYADGKVFYNTLDGQTIGLDAETARSSGGPRLATSTSARPSRWRLWSSGTRSWWATAVVNTGARISASPAGRPTPGGLAAAPSGAGSATTRKLTCSTTAPPIQARGTPSSGRATISGPPACSHAIPIPAKPSGSTSGPRTICTTTTGSTRMS